MSINTTLKVSMCYCFIEDKYDHPTTMPANGSLHLNITSHSGDNLDIPYRVVKEGDVIKFKRDNGAFLNMIINDVIFMAIKFPSGGFRASMTLNADADPAYELKPKAKEDHRNEDIENFTRALKAI